MKSSHPYLTLIVPAYNEAASITGTITAIRDYLGHQAWTWEVIIVADGNDGTRRKADDFAATDDRFTAIGSNDRRGKGRGVREGVLRANGELIGFLDADYKTPIDEIERILPAIEQGFDVVIGSRRVGSAKIEKPQPLYRRAGSHIFSLLMRNLMGLPDVRDTQCGFKFFTRSAAMQLFTLQRIDGYMFDIEILRLCKLLNLRVKETGVRWRDDADSRYKPVRGTIRNLKDLIRISRMKYEMPSAVVEGGEKPVREKPNRLVARL